MVLAGKVNKEIVSLISKYGGKASLVCRARTGTCSLPEEGRGGEDNQEIDLGHVGEVEKSIPRSSGSCAK